MTHNFKSLDALHEMFAAAGIEHHYTYGAPVITVTRGNHAWTVGDECIIYWGDTTDVCKHRWMASSWPADAYDYITDVYSKAQ